MVSKIPWTCRHMKFCGRQRILTFFGKGKRVSGLPHQTPCGLERSIASPNKVAAKMEYLASHLVDTAQSLHGFATVGRPDSHSVSMTRELLSASCGEQRRHIPMTMRLRTDGQGKPVVNVSFVTEIR